MTYVRTLVVALGLLIPGCAAHDLRQVPIASVRSEQLQALADGRTTREQVLGEWGEPSRRFEGGMVLSYLLDRRFAVVRPPDSMGGRSAHGPPPARWSNVAYDLVLVFDPGGVLERHRLLQVR
jgi:hypothetical protein